MGLHAQRHPVMTRNLHLMGHCEQAVQLLVASMPFGARYVEQRDLPVIYLSPHHGVGNSALSLINTGNASCLDGSYANLLSSCQTSAARGSSRERNTYEWFAAVTRSQFSNLTLYLTELAFSALSSARDSVGYQAREFGLQLWQYCLAMRNRSAYNCRRPLLRCCDTAAAAARQYRLAILAVQTVAAAARSRRHNEPYYIVSCGLDAGAGNTPAGPSEISTAVQSLMQAETALSTAGGGCAAGLTTVLLLAYWRSRNTADTVCRVTLRCV